MAEALAAVDDNSPDPEVPELCLETLREEAYQLEWRNKLTRLDIKQIKRRLHYQYVKDQEQAATDNSGGVDYYRIMMHRLCGTEAQKPRRLSAANMWRKLRDNAELVEKEFQRRLKAMPIQPRRKRLIAINDEVVRDLFAALPQEEQDSWLEVSKDEHERKLEVWRKSMEEEPSEDPADRQRCIQNLVKFGQPILDAICKATGWKATLIAGGPEPADEGHLNVISIHSGTTTGDHKMNFGRAERTRYKKHIVPIFGNFLQKCYSLDECRSRALPADNELQPLTDMLLEEEGANFDTGSFSSPLPEARGSEAPAKLSRDSPAGSADSADKGLIPQKALSDLLQSRPSAESNTLPTCLEDIDTPPVSPLLSPAIHHSPRLSPPASPVHQHSPPPSAVQVPETLRSVVPNKRRSDSSPTTTDTRASKKSKTAASKDVGVEPARMPPARDEDPDIPATARATTTESESPGWFTKALQMVETKSLGPEWVRLVDSWVVFEAKHFDLQLKLANLSPKHRPVAVRD
ncbi:hypothetical protein CPC08DRAFT_808783 [Agrocybe pediades]|nr:hypothetical protein CPC08DRAFT_808783 [Agrocybe pediades]